MTRLTIIVLLAAIAASVVVAAAPVVAQDRDRRDEGMTDEKHKKHRVQEALRSLETAEAYLDMAARRMQGADVRGVQDVRERVRRAEEDVDRGVDEVELMLSSSKTQRTIERGEAARTDRPIRAAADALGEAAQLLTNAEGDFDGHRKQAIDLVRTAEERVGELAQNEVAFYESDREGRDRDDRRARGDSDDRYDDDARTVRGIEMPADVRRAVEREAPGLEISAVTRDRDTGNYTVEGRSARQGRVEMRVSEDGEVLRVNRYERERD